MTLILDHINGIYNDNSLGNLRIVCPNCNATLDTHCGKNKKIKSIKSINEQNIEKRKRKNEIINKQIELIINSNVNFSKFGWVGKVAIIINKTPQKVNQWMKEHMLEFYETNCFKRNNNI